MSIDICLFGEHYFDGHYLMEALMEEQNNNRLLDKLIRDKFGKTERYVFYPLSKEYRKELVNKIAEYKYSYKCDRMCKDRAETLLEILTSREYETIYYMYY